MTEIKFGFSLPIFANPGMLFFRTPNLKRINWNDLLNATLECESLGYNSIFIADHLFLGYKGEIWECISTMSALAAKTTTLEIIPIHLCNNFRHPSITAKTLSTLSHISGGRISLFYDYGWRKREFDNYGIDFGLTDDERIIQMDEGIQVIKGMLKSENFSFRGKYYDIRNAINTPLPLKNIDVWMGEVNKSKMVESIVKHADVFNSMPCSLSGFKDKKEILLKEFGKQNLSNKLRYSLETQVLVRDTEYEIQKVLKSMKDKSSLNDSSDHDIISQLKKVSSNSKDFFDLDFLQDEFIIGTPDQVVNKIDQFCKEGIEHFMIWFMDYPERKSMRIFAEKVIPFFKN